MLLPPDLAYSVAIGASLQLADIRFSIMYHIKRFLIHKTGFNTHLVPQKRFMWYQIIILSNLSGDRPVFPGRFSDSAINCHGSRRRSVPAHSGATQFALWTSPPTGHETLSEENIVTQAPRKRNCASLPGKQSTPEKKCSI